MPNPLLVAEHAGGRLLPSSLSALGAASRLGDGVSVLVLGDGCAEAASEAGKLAHVADVAAAGGEEYRDLLPEPCSALIAGRAGSHSHVLMANGAAARNLLPRAAALSGCSMASDVVGIEAQDTFVRPVYAGKILETVRMSAPTKFLSVRATSFAAPEEEREGDPAPVAEADAAGAAKSNSRFVGTRVSGSDRPELTSANIVVSAGRGVGGAEGFAAVAGFADSIGAAVGASRAAVDAGYAPNELQVGQTGKVVAPELYIAVGISGAIQHVAGIMDAKTIVAVNKDPEAPIFEIADYGIVGDFREILPELGKALAAGG